MRRSILPEKWLSRKLKREGVKLEKNYYKEYAEAQEKFYEAIEDKNADEAIRAAESVRDTLLELASYVAKVVHTYLQEKHKHFVALKHTASDIYHLWKSSDRTSFSALQKQLKQIENISDTAISMLRKYYAYLQRLHERGQPMEFRKEELVDETTRIRKIRDFARLDFSQEKRVKKEFNAVTKCIKALEKFAAKSPGETDKDTFIKLSNNLHDELQRLDQNLQEELQNGGKLLRYGILELWQLYLDTQQAGEGVVRAVIELHDRQGFPEQARDTILRLFDDTGDAVINESEQLMKELRNDLSDAQQMT